MERAYRRDRWALQSQRVEVWSEKGTVRRTLTPVLDAYGVTFRVLHGHASATAVYQAVQEAAAGATRGEVAPQINTVALPRNSKIAKDTRTHDYVTDVVRRQPELFHQIVTPEEAKA